MRGPDDAQVALRGFEFALLELRELEGRMLRRIDELLAAQKRLDEAGIVAIEVRFGRELQTAIQVRRGEAFWDRAALDPTPAILTETDAE